MMTPIVEHKLCKKGKELFKEIYKLLCNGSLKKVELYNDEYNLLLKGVPYHRQDDYYNSIPIGTKLILRKTENG